MIYALGFGVFLAIVAVIACIFWTLTIKNGISTFLRANDAQIVNLSKAIQETGDITRLLSERVRTIETKPEPAVTERYKEVLIELEETQHLVRTLENRVDETLESVKRTQNKLAARTHRDRKAETEKVDQEIEDMTSAAAPPPANRQRIPFSGR